MKRSMPLLLQCTTASLVLVTAGIANADDVQILRVINDIKAPVKVEIMSQHPVNLRQPSVIVKLGVDQQTRIKLVSPDRFIAKVEFLQFSFTTMPMPLKQALAKNSRRVLYVSATVGADPQNRFIPEIDFSLDLPREEPPDAKNGQELEESDEALLNQIIDHRGRVRTERYPDYNSELRPAGPRKLGVRASKSEQGIYIWSVHRDTPATNCLDASGNKITLKAQDHIKSINGTHPKSIEHYVELIQQSAQTMQFTIINHRTNREMKLTTNLW